MRRIFFILLLSAIAAPLHAGHNGDRNSDTVISCLPDPATATQAVTCTATVTDLYGVPGQREAPTGTVSFSVVSGPGAFSPASCSLAATATTGVSSCSVTYTPSAGGSHTLSAAYSGGAGSGFIGNWFSSSGNTTITVNNPVPTLTSISPTFGLRGSSFDVTINGSSFASAGMTASFGTGVTVNSVTWVNSSTLTVNLSISAASATGFRDVSVTNPAPAGGSATLTNAFEVRNPLPVISNLVPSSAATGSGALVVTINGSGFVTDSVARFNGVARATTFINSAQLQMSLVAADTSVAGSYPVTVVNAAPGGGTSNSSTFSVVTTGGSFTTVESGAAVGTNMFTKLAGTSFGLDILATDVSRTSINTSFTGTVKVELLDATNDTGALDANGCRSTWTTALALPNQVFAGSDNGRISVNTNHVDALRAARFRVSYPAAGTPTLVGCSHDAFSIRPAALTLASTLNNTGSTGTPTHAAGANFSMTATAVAGYDGTPSLGVVTSHGGGSAGTVGGTFGTADAASGVANGNSFTYSEAGLFRYAAEEVYDNAFTAIDQPDDCVNSEPGNFSNILSGGKYGCAFGNTTATQWVGRFVPAYFDVTVIDACSDAGGFTYSGQPFEVTVTARNASGVTTQNYAGSFARSVTLSDAGDSSRFTNNTIAAVDFFAGTETVTDIEYAFTAATTPFETIELRAVDADGVSSAGHLEESTEIRSGRFVMANPSAISLQDALLTLELEAWQEISPGVHEWAVHADDTSCTTPGLVDFAFDAGSYTGSLSAGETTMSGYFFNAGQGAITLSAPGSGNSGSVEITGSVGDWLHYDRDADTVPDAPRGKVTFFEIFETEEGLIDRRETIQ